MATAELQVVEPSARERTSGGLFAACALSLAVCAAALAGWAPLGFSIVTVFLFAGPHNWLEARYFMARMPARWGPLRAYYLTGIAGVLGLTASFAALPWLGLAWRWDGETWLTAAAVWNTALIGWIAALVLLRSRRNPRREWPWTVPIALALVAAVWQWPREWGLVLVYAHPLLALWFLDRELGRHRPEWRGAYRACLAAVPLLLGVLVWRLADAPPLPGEDALSIRIVRHAGGDVLAGVSNRLLVAAHTFLEMLHYGVWLVAIPLVGLRSRPWRVESVPLGRTSRGWRLALYGVLAGGAVAVLCLWAGFLADYPLTRDIYFTVAMLHVLAEAPFLLRLL